MAPSNYKPPKKDVDAAWILARYYKTIINILRPINKYKVRTPDFFFNNKYYELKVLTSPQVRQLLVLLDEAKDQANNIIIDIRRTKITKKRAVEVCKEFMKKHERTKVSLIVSSKEVLDIEK